LRAPDTGSQGWSVRVSELIPQTKMESRIMVERRNERLAWFNGEFMPENQDKIPFRDQSWVYGDGCFDITRSLNHKLFKVKEHVDRLYRSLKYLRIDPGFGPERMLALT
jgi:branched-chain amino acid aminotransferase